MEDGQSRGGRKGERDRGSGTRKGWKGTEKAMMCIHAVWS